MRALDRKLLRDLRRLWPQALAIAVVLAAGVAILLMALGMYRALIETRAAYYERQRFAEVFASASRAPKTLEPEIAAIPGIWAVETRVTGSAILDLPGRAETAVGKLISLPVSGAPQLNVPLLRSGRLPDPAASAEIAVNEPFAEANGYRPGDVIHANLNGEKRALTITGTVLSPEFIYTIGPGALMPDNEGYGILWMPEPALAAAFDMGGAFNEVGLSLTRTANVGAVIDALDLLLDDYGGLGAHDRADQLSHAFIDAEIKQLRSMAQILPPVFFGIAAFLVNMVIGRIVALERSEIGLLKALGYSKVDVSLHYVTLSGLIGCGGIGAGFALGTWLSRQLAIMYAEFFDFPYVIFAAPPEAYVIAGGLGLATTLAGALQAALYAARLPAAVAMAPPVPPRYRRTLLDRLLVLARMSQPTMMILRGILRWPVRAGLTALGIGLGTAVLVASSFFDDALETIVDSAFFQTSRQDASLIFTGALPEPVLDDIRRLPGVLRAEGDLRLPAILRNGHLEKTIAIEARADGNDLTQIVDADGRVASAPPGGILLSERLAASLDVAEGDTLEAEFLTGRRETHSLTVSGTVQQYFGIGAYMADHTLNALLRQAPQITGANVSLDSTQEDAFHAALKDMPKLAGTVMLTDTRVSFQDTIDENITVMTSIYIIVAVLITAGVTYNSARIQLSERARDLASLRILGFTRLEVSYILVGETILLAILAQPIGWLLGYALARAMTDGFASDLYSVPLVLKADTFTTASLVVLAATVLATMLVRRRLDRLDLVEVMKTRE